jgi:hypothetical protein
MRLSLAEKMLEILEQFTDTKGIIRIRKSKTQRRENGQQRDKRTDNDLKKTLHRELKIEQHEPH